jgi:hypothetical protein
MRLIPKSSQCRRLRAVAPLPSPTKPSLSLRCREGTAQSVSEGASPSFPSNLNPHLHTPSPKFGVEPEKLAEREGFEPPFTEQPKSFVKRALSCL